MSLSREEHVYMAKLSEQAERYEGLWNFSFFFLFFFFCLCFFVESRTKDFEEKKKEIKFKKKRKNGRWKKDQWKLMDLLPDNSF